MAYRNLQIKFNRVSNLRGDGDTSGDGGYANKDFYIETHLETSVITSPDGIKKTIVRVIEPEIKKMFANSLNRKAKRTARK